jgi:hypothetical protein
MLYWSPEEAIMIQCSRCNREIPQEESYSRAGEVLCEDCYIKAGQSVQACDPVAVRLATRIREKMGAIGADNLTDTQKAIYEFVQSKGKVTPQEILNTLGLSLSVLETQLAILRHCELLKGRKENDTHYIVPFSYKE